MKKIALLMFVVFTQACSTKASKNDSVYLKLMLLLEEHKLDLQLTNNNIIYYFDGDCSFCIDKLKQLNEKYDEKLLAIAHVGDLIVFNYMIKENTPNLQNRLIVVENDKFDKILLLNSVYIVNKEEDQITRLE
ncbi:hypothetical protein [Belliella aquatica]|uniref:Lipoprotein n=1 Tax=Belliella aquatica TaxID=1323734 RepID=A0ABQ1N8C9_9BACT|nr:hypothetical protein [Belliella aquatica]MCH7407528.1 hypothetical protein [Belliella aquatica]GGC54317.1 hypothetical protein GCM10010993_35910 [Belliella aquatica]